MPSFREQFPSIDVEDAPPEQRHDKSTIQGLSTNQPVLPYSNTLTGTVVATYVLLGTFGALGCTFLGDVLGRRMTIFIASATQVVGNILMATSYSLGQFIVGRVFIGLGTGGIVACVPVWQAELSRAESRGSHVSSMGIYCGTGLSLALWVGFGFSFTTGSVSWRVPLAGSGVLSIIVMAFIFLLPDSPRWYVLPYLMYMIETDSPTGSFSRIVMMKLESCSTLFTMGIWKSWIAKSQISSSPFDCPKSTKV